MAKGGVEGHAYKAQLGRLSKVAAEEHCLHLPQGPWASQARESWQ